MKTVWAVCKDPGGTANLLPILPVLRERGLEVKLFLQEGGKGESVIKNSSEEYRVLAEPLNTSYVIYGEPPDIFVTSMCSGESIGRDLLSFFKKEGVPTVALQDFWGARLKTDWADSEYRPDLICVNDEVGKEIVLDAWNIWDEKKTRVAVTGYPSFDALAKTVLEPTRGLEVLGVNDDLPVVLYPGQIWHAGEMLLELVEALIECNIPCHLVATRHGRMSEAGEEEIRLWEEAERRFPWKIHTTVDFRQILNIVAASRVVVGMYSTIQIQAAALGIQTISMLYPERGATSFIRETGGVMREFPLVELGCSAKATNRGGLRSFLKIALTENLGLHPEQAKAFRLDGKNAERTAEAVLSLLH
ncbi:MAG: hypothetical protein WBL19_00205 [Minisyncoccia bacterium]